MAIQTSAKVRFLTGKGNIDIELYAKELPVACRAFLQNCIDGRFVGLHFGRLLPEFIELTPNSQKTHIRREFHSRIGFGARGDVALLNVGVTQLASPDGFFITMMPLPALNKKYVMIGHVVGDLIYNVVNIQAGEKIIGTTAPVYPVTVTGVEILQPYFEDLVRSVPQVETREVKRAKPAVQISYDDEDDSDDGYPFSMGCAPDLTTYGNWTVGMDENAERERELMRESVMRAQARIDSEEIMGTEEAEKSLSGAFSIPPFGAQNSGKSKSKDLKRSKSTSGDLKQPALAPYNLYLDFWEDKISGEDLRKHRYVCS